MAAQLNAKKTNMPSMEAILNSTRTHPTSFERMLNTPVLITQPEKAQAQKPANPLIDALKVHREAHYQPRSFTPVKHDLESLLCQPQLKKSYRCAEKGEDQHLNDFLWGPMALLAGVATADLAVSCILTVWKAILGSDYSMIFERALIDSDMEVIDCTWPELMEYYGITQRIVGEPQGDFLEVVDEYVLCSYLCYTMQCLVKQLNGDNYEKFTRSRATSYKNKFGMDQDMEPFLIKILPNVQNCTYIRTRLGNKIAFRQQAYKAARRWASLLTQNSLNYVGEMLMVMFKNTDMTHLALIQRYIVDSNPAALLNGYVRNEAAYVYLALRRLAQLQDEAPYARLLFTTREAPELSRSLMQILSAYATQCAQRDSETFKNYKNPDRDQFKLAFNSLQSTFEKSVHFVPRMGMDFLEEEYDADTAQHVRGALQGNMTRVSTIGSAMLKWTEDDE